MQLDWPTDKDRRHGRQLQMAGRSAHREMDDNCNEMDDVDGECDCELCQLVGSGQQGCREVGFVNVGELSGSRFDLK